MEPKIERFTQFGSLSKLCPYLLFYPNENSLSSSDQNLALIHILHKAMLGSHIFANFPIFLHFGHPFVFHLHFISSYFPFCHIHLLIYDPWVLILTFYQFNLNSCIISMFYHFFLFFNNINSEKKYNLTYFIS